jgi:hypothetical protein
MGSPLEVACSKCARRGRYRGEGLIEDFGDIPVRAAMLQIAARAGCRLALNPPAVTEIDYAVKCCQIKRIIVEADI